jgi:uncharacterized protein Smg (DUF494 family)
MNDKIIEILIQLLGHLKEHDLDIDSIGEFTDGLVTRGYDEHEVTEAIHWFIEKMNSRSVMSTEIHEQSSGSIRVLHENERINISPDVYGYLLKLKSMEVVTGAQMEKILDYYMLLGSNSMNDIDINEIIASILFEN